jgi:hypothetical protein
MPCGAASISERLREHSPGLRHPRDGGRSNIPRRIKSRPRQSIRVAFGRNTYVVFHPRTHVERPSRTPRKWRR